MTPRTLVALLAAAGMVAEVRGQEVMQVSYSWSEVVAGTLTPVASPNSVLEPGEGARIGLNLFATINGISAIGQTTTYTPPPPPGVGTVRGLASMIFNLAGNNGAATAAGSWNDRAVTSVWNAGSFAGNPLQNGALVDSFGGGQFVAPGQTCDATNPISDAFRGVWNPASYQTRTVNFKATPGTVASFGQYAGVMLQYGTGFTNPADPTTAYALYFTKYVSINFGTGIDIPIVPAPASGLALAGAAAISASRRRRQ